MANAVVRGEQMLQDVAGDGDGVGVIDGYGHSNSDSDPTDGDGDGDGSGPGVRLGSGEKVDGAIDGETVRDVKGDKRISSSSGKSK